MPEIIWKQGAENDLLQIFAEFEERSEEAGVRFVGKLDFTLGHLRAHPEMAPMFEKPVRALSSVRPGTACSIPSKHAASLCMRLSI
jgi:plasmid stabilization system protein ParE